SSTLPSQKSPRFRCTAKSGGALRGMIRPPTRSGPNPMPPTPRGSVRPSPVAKSGRWHVAHETSSLPDRTLSKKSAWPSAKSSSDTTGGAGRGRTRAAESSERRRSTSVASPPPPPEDPPPHDATSKDDAHARANKERD